MRKLILFGFLAATPALLTNCGDMKIKMKPYPQAEKQAVVDDYHGTIVADPYRWLEDDNSEATAAWVKAENEVTFDYLGQIPYRDKVKKRLTQLWDYAKYSVPREVGGYLFFTENPGLNDQGILYRQSLKDGSKVEFVNPNTMADDGTAAIIDIVFSKDEKYMAYVVAKSGSDWAEIRVMEVEAMNPLEDVVKWVKFSGVSWCKEGFYYSGYEQPAEGTELSAQNHGQKVYFHKLGTAQSEDQVIYQDKADQQKYFTAKVSKDFKFLFVTVKKGTSGTELLYKSLTDPKASFKALMPGFANDHSVVWSKGDRVIVHTNLDAPNGRLVDFDLSKAKPEMRELVAEHKSRIMEDATVAGGDALFISYIQNSMSRVFHYDLQGGKVGEVRLPEVGTSMGFCGGERSRGVYYSFTSFVYPSTIFRYDIGAKKSEVAMQPKVKYDPRDFTTEQIFFRSADSTAVSMFLVHKKDVKLDGKNPLFLYGYGGFNISLTPMFSPSTIALLEQGGIYAQVNLRGGGEYGEKWHKAGMLENKQKVFDDFISAAEYLVNKGYTSPAKLAIAGASNGGLLVGACMTQRPDLFAVALPAVGVMDMLRYDKFTVGWGWKVEYGSSDNAEQFEYLYKYSPLHNIRPGVCYPATLITTADHDDRVVPAHSFKFAAQLQDCQACDKPVLIRVDTNAGHGMGKPVYKKIEEQADVMSFMFWNTGSKYRKK